MADTHAEYSVLTRRRRPWLGPIILVVLCGTLFNTGARWGLPTTVSWSQDTIAGMRTVNTVKTWPDHWVGRYPPLHYFILRAAYSPIIRHWKAEGHWRDLPSTDQVFIAEPQSRVIGSFLIMARKISALAGIAAVIGIWATARVLTRDDLAAFIAGLSMAVGAAFVYFAHLGNVDVPAMAWFAWSVYFYVRLIKTSSCWNAIGLGLLGGLAVATKDSTAGVYPGMALVLVISSWMNKTQHDQSSSGALVRAVFDWRWAVGLLAFALPCLYLNGAFHNWTGYITRLEYWLSPPAQSLHANQLRYSSQLELLLATVRYASGAVGWPMVISMFAASIYAVMRKPQLALTILIPVASYYVIVIAPIHFVYSRFLFVPIGLLCVLVGVLAAALIRNRLLSMAIKVVLLCAVALPTLGYAIAINAEMLTDSRYEAEAWFEDHVDKKANVGAFAMGHDPKLRAQYLPRLHELGYATYPVVMDRAWFDKPQPEYLVLTSYNFEDFDNSQRVCKADLLAGRLGYEVIAMFKGRYLGTGSSWLSIAGWGAPTPGKISPTIIVMNKKD